MRGALVCVLAIGLALACSRTPQRPGVEHVVREGETVWRIARHYGVEPDAILRANRIDDVRRLAVGTRLVVPGADPAAPDALPPRQTPEVAVASLEATAREALKRSTRNRAVREGDLAFAWPLHGRVTSRFGTRGRRRHEGLDLAARRGTTVRATEAGRVIYSGRMGDYGRIVVVQHRGAYSSVYAHNKRNWVKKGAAVRKGERIAEVGDSGNATGPHLHFEIRYAERARDPELFLP